MSYLIIYALVLLLVTFILGMGVGYHMASKTKRNFKKQKQLYNRILKTIEN